MRKSAKRGRIRGTILFHLILLLCFTSLSAEEKVAVTSNGVVIQFSALTQIWFTSYFGYKAPTPDASTFKLRRSQLQFSGAIDNDKINWVVMLDPAARPSSPLQDLYINLNYVRNVEFRAGQFKLPFTLESITPSGQLDFIERTLIVRAFSEKRDIGVMVSSRFKNFEGQLGLINGSGQNTTDPNYWKDYVGRIVVKPTSSFALGTSGYYGYSPTGLTVKNGKLRTGTNDLWRGGVDVKFDYSGLSFRSEAIWARSDTSIFVLGSPSLAIRVIRRKEWGGYSSFLYNILVKHQACARFEWFDPNTNVGRDATFITTLGYNFLLTPRTKFQLNLQSQVEQKGNAENRDFYIILTNLQVSF